MQTLLKLFLITGLSLNADFAGADSLSFKEVWHKIHASSAAQEGARLRSQADKKALTRTQRHWLPKVYLDARSYRTNDPGNVFFGLLQQRNVEVVDFAPSAMNNPAPQNFSRSALGLDLLLYEGGMKNVQVEMHRHISTASHFTATQTQIDQYAQTGLAYGSIATLQRQKAKLSELKNELEKLIKNYQLGQRSNPVGYSGLLGMKSLLNRMTALMKQFEAQEKASYIMLKEMGLNNEGWKPDTLEVRTFSDQYLSPSPQENESTSYKLLAATQNTQTSSLAAQAEKARYLPRVGAFAESYLFNGDRDTANGYTAGIYLQWSLFDPSDYGRYEEAKVASLAAEKFNTANIQQENSERKSLSEAIYALKSTLGYLDESDELLAEQARISSLLFKNGSINALQFVEILNRRTDLISQQLEAEISLLKHSTDKLKISKFEISEDIFRGPQ